MICGDVDIYDDIDLRWRCQWRSCQHELMLLLMIMWIWNEVVVVDNIIKIRWCLCWEWYWNEMLMMLEMHLDVLRVRWWRIFNSINKLCGWTIYSFWTYKHLTVNCAWNSLKDYIVLLFVFWYFLPNLEIILSSQLTLFRARISVSDDKNKEDIMIIIACPRWFRCIICKFCY